MARNERAMQGLSTDQVFDALRDGNGYGNWVVGTRKIRTVDPTWPAPGTSIHYTVGYAPFRKDDITTVSGIQEGRRLELEAHAWPAGSARIDIAVHPAPNGCRVVITEHPLRGLARLLHNPLLDLTIKVRNVETLRRLEQHARRLTSGRPR